jgi:hypothetical protein
LKGGAVLTIDSRNTRGLFATAHDSDSSECLLLSFAAALKRRGRDTYSVREIDIFYGGRVEKGVHAQYKPTPPIVICSKLALCLLY